MKYNIPKSSAKTEKERIDDLYSYLQSLVRDLQFDSEDKDIRLKKIEESMKGKR